MDTLTATLSKTAISAATDDHPPSKWSDPPSDILQNLLRYIDLQIDLPRLRGVNTSWRSSLSLLDIPKLPSKFQIPNIDHHRSLLLLQTHLYFLSPLDTSNGGGQWLAKMGKIEPNKWHVFNPLNVLDYFQSFPKLTGEINLLDCRIQELSNSWCVIGDANRDDAKPISRKVVGGWNFRSHYLFAVLIQLETPGKGSEGGLVFWRLYDDKCIRYEETFLHNWRILDTAYFNGEFYAFELAGWRIGVIDPEDDSSIPEMKFFDAPKILGEHINGQFSLMVDDCKYLLMQVFLVPSNDRLLMLILGETLENPKKTTLFVYALKEGDKIAQKSWERMPNLRDEIFFIGYDGSFSLPSASKNLPQWKPNSICLFLWPFPMIFDYGKPKYVENVNFPQYWRYLQIYNPEEREKGVVKFANLDKEIYTGLFFPPPAWVKWYCPSHGNAEVKLHNLKFHEEDWSMYEEKEEDDDE